MAVVFVILFISIAIIIPFYLFSKWNFNYWEKRKVPYLKPKLLVGNYQEYITVKESLLTVAHKICKQFPEEPYIGTYFGTEPALLVQDLDLIKLMFVKDYPYFSGREVSKYCRREVLTRNMFFTFGDNWKVVRQHTSPLFTMSKLKNMFPLIQKCTKSLEDMLNYESQKSDVLNAQSLMARYTMDCIGSCVFGVDTNTMSKGKVEDNPFRKIGDLIFENSVARCVATYSRAIWPAIFYGVGLSLFPKVISDFFHNLILDVFKERGYKPSSRNDFVDLLLALKQNEYLTCESILKSKKGEQVTVKVDDEWLVGQCVLYFGAGYETSANTTGFTLYFLARDQDIQKKAFAEIDQYMKQRGGTIEFDCMTELPYLEACIDEALRFFPPLGLLTREVLEPYELPTGLKLDKGLRIHVPVYHLHKNPKYFPEPEEYRPERFLPENKSNITPYSYMPFGEGQRICVGMRLAKMQMMPGLITALRHFRVELAEGTPNRLTIEARTMVTMSRERINLKFIPRK